MTPELLIAGIGILIFSVIAHEVAHGYMAQFLGDPTARLAGRLTMNPAKHLDPIGSFVVPLFSYFMGGIMIGWAKPVPYNPYNLRNQRWGEAMVAAAGPAVNLLIAIIFGLIIRSTVGLIGPNMVEILTYIVDINIVLMVFNLSPIPPLDGFKIFSAFLPGRMTHIVRSMERYSLMIMLFYVFFLWSFVSPIISILHNIIV